MFVQGFLYLVNRSSWYCSGTLIGHSTVLPRRMKSLQKVTERHASNEIEIIDVSDYKPRKISPPLWRECIKKIWEVDPLECPHYNAEMKIISFIKERPVIRKILEHLNL